MSKSGRSVDQPPKGQSAFAALFRNVLRSPFGHQSGRASTRREAGPGSPAVAATQSRSQSTAHSPGSIGSGGRPQLPDVAEVTETATQEDSLPDLGGDQSEAASIDAALLARETGALTDPDAPMEDRIAALQDLVPELQGRVLSNLVGLWVALEDIVEFGFCGHDGADRDKGSDDRANDGKDEGELLREEARLLILGLLVVLAKSGQDIPGLDGGQPQAQEVQENMLAVIGQASGWAEIALAAQCAAWASDDARRLVRSTAWWFARARGWVEQAAEQCYPEGQGHSASHGHGGSDAGSQTEALDDPVTETLTMALEFLSHMVAADYPVLDADEVSATVGWVCTASSRTRDAENGSVAWEWTGTAHLAAVLGLLQTVIKYGALAQGVLEPAVVLLCTTVGTDECESLCRAIVYTLFTSCYMRDTLLAMNHILRRGSALLSTAPIRTEALSPQQTAVNGIVYYITRVMDTGPTGFQFSLRTGNCLPVLGEAARCMHPDVLRLVFPYLCRIVNDDRVDSMLADDWAVLIGILETTAGTRLAPEETQETAPSPRDSPMQDPPSLRFLYDGALQAVVGVFRRDSDLPPAPLVDLLYRLRTVLTDELAQSMLKFIHDRGDLRPGSSNWRQVLEETMHLYYFDRARSTPLRRNMARLCADIFNEAFGTDAINAVSIPFIVAMLDQLHLEDDEKVIENILEIMSLTLRRTRLSHTFRDVLGFAIRAAIEPDYRRPLQPAYQRTPDTETEPEAGLDLESRLGGLGVSGLGSPHHSARGPSQQLLHVSTDGTGGQDEKASASWARVTQTTQSLLEVFEWRVAITDTISDDRYAESAADTIALAGSLLDLLQSEHTFPSVQRRILKVFFRLHSDADLRLYILRPGRDTVIDQRVSLHENARLRLVAPETDTPVSAAARSQFPVQHYVDALLYVFQTNTDIETYRVLCRGLMIQLSNTYLFSVCISRVEALLEYVIGYMRTANYGYQARSRLSSAEKNRIATVTYGLLVSVMHYKDLDREYWNMLILTLDDGLSVSSSASDTPLICLHALTVAMLELPEAVERTLVRILEHLVKIYSAAQLSVHLLEFVSAISRDSWLYANFRTKEYRVLFAVSINYIRFHNNQRRRRETSMSAAATPTAEKPDGPDKPDPRRLSSAATVEKLTISDIVLDQYVLVMAYQVIDVYYLSLTPVFKAEIFDSLVIGLLQSNYSRTNLDELNEVCLDMILQFYHRTNREILALDGVAVKEDLGPVIERSWIQHNGIITIRAQTEGPLAQIVVRTASNTTSRTVNLPEEVAKKHAERSERPPLPPAPPLPTSPDSPVSAYGVMSQAVSRGRSIGRSRRLQSMAGVAGTPSAVSEQTPLPADSIARLLRGELIPQDSMSRGSCFPLRFDPGPCLALDFIHAYQGLQDLDLPVMLPPRLEAVARSLRIFDNTPNVDTHKVSVAYVGPGQTTEREILLNQQGSPAYWNFLRGLGDIMRLGGMKDFSAGLDTSGQDSDGRYTIGWRDLITKLIFHVGTLMPAQEGREEQIVRKKAHMGNDYVHIVFNESGKDYEFDTIASQFNFVQIIVTPVDGEVTSREEDGSWLDGKPGERKARTVQLYKVRTQVNPNVPFKGPAAEPKVLTLTALPAFVRAIAIHAAIFSQVYTSCKSAEIGSADYVSLWRARLQIIKRVRAHAQRETVRRSSAAGQPHSSSSSPGAAAALDMEEFGELVSDPSQAATASQALAYLIQDLESYRQRE
ncbi:Tuberous sclerosis 2-like protein [Coemansia sp. RSA 552]|nr:Tuberous sclerosis 2-like protein [Coemansia sp. RSA 552]